MNIEGTVRIICDECGDWEETEFDPTYMEPIDAAIEFASDSEWIVDECVDNTEMTLCYNCRENLIWCEICEDEYTFDFVGCFDTYISVNHQYCMEDHHERMRDDGLIEPYMQYCPECEYQMFANPVVGNRKPLLKLKAST